MTKLKKLTLTLAMFTFIQDASAQFINNSNQDLEDIADNIRSNLSAVVDLIMSGAFVIGVGLVVFGLLNLKKASDENARETYSKGFWMIAIGVFLIALGSVAGSGVSTFFGTNTNTSENFL